MKQIPALLLLGLALTLCNLGDKLKSSNNSSSPGKSSSSSDGVQAEKPVATAAQTEALAGGQTAKWDNQGMSWSVPANWKESSNESKQLLWRSPGGSDAANLIVSIST